MYRAMGQLSVQAPSQFSMTNAPTPVRTAAPADLIDPIKVQARAPCLNGDQLLVLGACFSGLPPPGIPPSVFAQACTAFRDSGVFDLAVCPDAKLPPLPDCLDAEARTNIAYCEQYPNSDGPNAYRNGVCWAARKAPTWYNTLKSRMACVTDQLEPDFPQPEPPAEPPADTEPNYLLWGGLALLVVAATGGVIYYAKQK